MYAFNPAKAQAFIKGVVLPDVPESDVPEVNDAFDQAKSERQLVGEAVLSFTQGITADDRKDIANAALLAQLAANKASSQDPLNWAYEYRRVLESIGWTLQKSDKADYKADGTELDVHKEIITALAAILGGGAALVIVEGVVKALQNMQPDNPWLVLFKSNSRAATVSHFQVGLVDKDDNKDLLISMCACVVHAKTDLTQILFFKFGGDTTDWSTISNQYSINRDAFNGVRELVRQRVAEYQSAFLSSIEPA